MFIDKLGLLQKTWFYEKCFSKIVTIFLRQGKNYNLLKSRTVTVFIVVIFSCMYDLYMCLSFLCIWLVYSSAYSEYIKASHPSNEANS